MTISYFTISTSGSLLTVKGTLAQVRAYMESMWDNGLKRGWTLKWDTWPDYPDHWRLSPRNSKGNRLPGRYSMMLVQRTADYRLGGVRAPDWEDLDRWERKQKRT